MLLSVAICTWNRSRLLRQTLEDLTRLAIPAGVEWELLVVNNNCTDDTSRVVSSFRSRLPVRPLFEARQGHTHARNAAINAFAGEYILWTDDDVRVDAGWIEAYAQAFRERPAAAFFGGPIRPLFERSPPDWLRRVWPRVSTAYGERELGPEPLRFDGRKLTPFGANYALQGDEQRRRPYHTGLGRRPGSMVAGDETTLVQAMLADGLEGWWVPGASVRHFVPDHQLGTRYLRRYFIGLGQTLEITEPSPPAAGPLFRGRPRAEWRAAIDEEAEYWKARFRKPPEKWIEKLISSSIRWGRLSRRRGSATAPPTSRRH